MPISFSTISQANSPTSRKQAQATPAQANWSTVGCRTDLGITGHLLTSVLSEIMVASRSRFVAV